MMFSRRSYEGADQWVRLVSTMSGLWHEQRADEERLRRQFDDAHLA
jgi:hypothetical protein